MKINNEYIHIPHWYHTCYIQYATNFMVPLLCMQGTQGAPYHIVYGAHCGSTGDN